MTRVAALIIRDRSVALIERRQADELYYVFPGGRVEEGETLREAVEREVEEELGLVIEAPRLIAEVSYKGSIQYYFLGKVVGGAFGTGQGPEMLGRGPFPGVTYTPVWMPVRDLLQRPVYPCCVAEAVIEAVDAGWPQAPLQLYDAGRT